MGAIAAIEEDEEPQEGDGSVARASDLSPLERIFVDTFVATGGNARAAAIAAGIDEGKAAVQACRWLCKRRVADYIFKTCQRMVHASLPVAIKALMDIAADPEALRKDRIKAATSLLEHGGMAAPKGGVQVNVGVAVNGNQAQQLIASVWDARSKRLSDIPPAMPDTLDADFEAIGRALESPSADGPGGDQLQGPAPASAPIPAHSTATVPIPGVSRDGAASTFRSAFDDDDE